MLEVVVTADREQHSLACGYVGAHAVNLLKAADDLMSVDVSDAVDEQWIDRGNNILCNSWLTSDFLEKQEVDLLTQVFREDAFPSERRSVPWGCRDSFFPHADWPLSVGSLDWVVRRLGETAMGYVDSGLGAAPRSAFFISNTDDCRRCGTHWFTIGVSMQWVHSV